MIHVNRILVPSAVLAVLASVCAAQSPGERPGGPGGIPAGASAVDAIVARMMSFDTNKDDKVARAEVTDARLSLLQARTNLAQALSDFYVAEATVNRALGGSATTTGTR